MDYYQLTNYFHFFSNTHEKYEKEYNSFKCQIKNHLRVCTCPEPASIYKHMKKIDKSACIFNTLDINHILSKIFKYKYH